MLTDKSKGQKVQKPFSRVTQMVRGKRQSVSKLEGLDWKEADEGLRPVSSGRDLALPASIVRRSLTCCRS